MSVNNKNTNTGYIVPTDYFNTIEKEVLNKLNVESTINQSFKTGYKTPDEYFKNLDKIILNQVSKKNKIRKIFNNKKVYYLSGVAAMLILSLFVFTKKDTENLNFNHISDTAIESYLYSDNIGNTSPILFDVLSESADFNQLYFYEIKNETITDYLEKEIEIDVFYEYEL
jgi:hypothetical protein